MNEISESFWYIPLELPALKQKALETAREFKKALKEELPELILLDIMLPGEDGYTLLEELKKEPSTSEIPVIMVTAKEAEYDKVRGAGGRSR